MADPGAGDEVYSMGDLETDLKKSRGARRAPWFLVGLVLGIAGTIAVPRYLGPYLPEALRGNREILSGPVLGEERDGNRLLLTIDTEPGALIASFSRRVNEIALLVEVGDEVTIAVPDYEPFVENPDFEGVKKRAGRAAAGQPARPDSALRAGTPPAGTESGGPGVADSLPSTPPDTGAVRRPAGPDSAGVPGGR